MVEIGRDLWMSCSIMLLLKVGSSRASCPGLCPLQFWISLRMEAPRTVWATCSRVSWHNSERIFLMLKWNVMYFNNGAWGYSSLGAKLSMHFPLLDFMRSMPAHFSSLWSFPLNGSTTIWCTNHSPPALYHLWELAERILGPIIQVMNEDLKQHCPQCQPLGYTNRN